MNETILPPASERAALEAYEAQIKRDGEWHARLEHLREHVGLPAARKWLQACARDPETHDVATEMLDRLDE